jgi:hypothetical protein
MSVLLSECCWLQCASVAAFCFLFSLCNGLRRCIHAGEVPPSISNVTGWLQDTCLADMTPRQLYELQDLFSVYVHRMPGAPGADESSLFYQRDIKNRCSSVPLTCERVCFCHYIRFRFRLLHF